MPDTFKSIQVISRESPLALKQVAEVFELLPSLSYVVKALPSYGDKHLEHSLLSKTPADFFTRELDEALLQGSADLAIHSAKDLPYPLADGLEVIALTAGLKQTDALVSRGKLPLAQLPQGAKVGTSSPTRCKELLALRSDVEVVSIRGTIQQRLDLIEKGTIDALIVASCALTRLGLAHLVAEVLPFETHPLQGNLALVAKKDRTDLKALFTSIDSRTSYGKVTLVGFGPGNPDLLTIGGDIALQKADIILHDDLLDKTFLEKYRGEKVYVGKRKDKHSLEQGAINRLILDYARAGKETVRLKGGDPMVFAHGGEEVEYLQSNLISVDVIPGVSTGIAVSSLTKVPLTHRGIASSVAFISGHSEEVQIPQTDTLVYYMAGSNIKGIAQKAIAQGKNPSTPVMLVHNVSLPDQQEFFATLQELSETETKYPTPIIIVIGEVVHLRNHGAEAFETKQVLVTGTLVEKDFLPQRAQSFYSKVTKEYKVIHQPLIEIQKIEDNTNLKSEILNLKSSNWLFFTSRYSVQFFFETLEEMSLDTRYLNNIKIASVGNITSEALKQRGITVDLQAIEESSEGLLKEIQTQNIAPEKVLIPRSDIGLSVLPEGLKALGWEVKTVAVYHNVLPDNIEPVDLANIDSIVFSSPSCVTNFLKVYGEFPNGKEFIFREKETEKRFAQLANSRIS